MPRAQDRARSARSRKNGARSATIESRALGALKLAREAGNENVPAKRADFLFKVGHTTERPCIGIGMPLSLSAPQVIYPTSLRHEYKHVTKIFF